VRHQFGAISVVHRQEQSVFFFSYDQQNETSRVWLSFCNRVYLNTLAAGTTGRAALTAATATKGLTGAQIDNALNFLTSTTAKHLVPPGRSENNLSEV